jgi:MFS family permease
MMVTTGILGIGFGLSSTLYTVVVQSAVEWNFRGAAMGTINLMRNLGQTIGIAISGLWLSEELHGSQLAKSLHHVFFFLVLLAILTFFFAMMLIGRKLKQTTH